MQHDNVLLANRSAGGGSAAWLTGNDYELDRLKVKGFTRSLHAQNLHWGLPPQTICVRLDRPVNALKLCR